MRKRTHVKIHLLFCISMACITACSAATNHVLNASFEINSNPGLADCWGKGGWGLRSLEEINHPEEYRSRLSIDTSDCVHGMKCMRISNPVGKPPLSLFSTWISYPQFLAGRKGWCVSAYIKVSPPATVVVSLLDSQYRLIAKNSFAVEDKWQRYSFPIKTNISPVVIRISPPEGTNCLIDCVQFSQGEEPGEWSPAADETMIATPKVPPREYVSSITVKTKMPEAVKEVKSKNGWIHVNSNAFFPYAIGMQYEIDLPFLQKIKECGFNTVKFYALNPNQTKKNLDLSYQAGLRAIPWLRCKASEISEMVECFKNHPALVTWLALDEPPEPFVQKVTNLIKSVKDADQERPSWVNYRTNEINRFMDKLPSLPGDIISADWYPVTDMNYPAKPCDPAELIKKMTVRLKESDKIVWFILQLCGNAFMLQREPTPEEFEGMVYSSIIAGANGLFFFQNIPWNARLMEVAGKIGAELESLTPILANGDFIDINVSESVIKIKSLLYQGELYIFAVNTSEKPLTCRFNFGDGISNPKKITVLFEERSLIMTEDHVLTDQFNGFQRHIYHLQKH